MTHPSTLLAASSRSAKISGASPSPIATTRSSNIFSSPSSPSRPLINASNLPPLSPSFQASKYPSNLPLSTPATQSLFPVAPVGPT